MKKSISKRARTEVIAALHQRYQAATKREKARILNEFVAVAQCHRKHAVRLLGNGDGAPVPSVQVAGRRVYDEAVREALIIAWEAADRICGKRLKAILPSLLDAMVGSWATIAMLDRLLVRRSRTCMPRFAGT